nr:MAG TPA: Protein of unknown function (DUF1056) [Caudoviricetes sp.]
MIGGFRLKYYDIIFLLGILIILSTTLYIDVIYGLYLTGAFFVGIGLLVASKHKERG